MRARCRRWNRGMRVRPGVSSFAADGDLRFRAIRYPPALGAGGGTRGMPSAGSFGLSREDDDTGKRARVHGTRLANALRANAVASTDAREGHYVAR